MTQRATTCHCGKEMEFHSEFYPGVEESDDYYKCTNGHKMDYYEVEDLREAEHGQPNSMDNLP